MSGERFLFRTIKAVCFGAVLMLLLGMLSLHPQIAFASSGNFDASSFKINSLKIVSQGPYSSSAELLVEMDATCGAEGFRMSDIRFYAAREGGSAEEPSSYTNELSSIGSLHSAWCEHGVKDPVLRSGKHLFGLKVPSEAGRWRISQVTSSDYSDEPAQFPIPSANDEISFIVDPELQDKTPPVLCRLKVENAYQGEMARVTFDLDDAMGLEMARVRLKSVTGADYVDFTGYPNAEFWEPSMDVQLPYNAKLGNWIVEEVELTDKSGNTSRYELGSGETASGKTLCRWALGRVRADAVAADYFRVGVPEDREVKPPAPVITSVKVLNANSIVQRPGVLRLQVGVHEESGATTRISIDARREDGRSYASGSFGPYKSGMYVLDIPIPAEAYVGKWKLNLSLSDGFGNYTVLSASDSKNESGISTVKTGYYRSSASSYDQVIYLPGFQVEDEFHYAVNLSLSHPGLANLIKQMKDGDAARVRIDGKGVLPSAVFDAIRGTEKTVVCWSDSYQWVFNGKDIVRPSKDVNLLLEIGKINGQDLGIKDDAVFLDFKSNGVLPGKVQVRFKSDYLYRFAGVKGTLKLFYVNGPECTQEPTNFDLVFDGADKWCHVDIAHNSRFLIAAQAITSVKTKINAARVTGIVDRAYTGKAVPLKNIKVKVGSKVLTEGVDYTKRITNSKGKTIKASAVKQVGKYFVVFEGKGKYFGTKKASFCVNPKGTRLKKVTAKKKALIVAWRKQSKMVDGYQVRYSTSKKMKGAKVVTLAKAKETSCKIGKLKSGKRYYVQVRTYKKVSGKRYCSSWSAAKSAKVK